MAHSLLVVDDNPFDLGRLKKLLSGAGYQVNTAVNGALALAAVKHDRPDAVLMDINMPEMDGFSATRALRNDLSTRDIPVVLVSAKDQRADKAWGQMLGARAYITKPFTDEQVLSVVRTL